LAVEEDTVPDVLEVTARTDNGIIMGLKHRDLPLHGVQFHPESVLTEGGHRLLANWLEVCGLPDAEARSAGLSPLVRRS
ncbi:MAG: glutamine amidotransferase-related protein, partial [Demequina sp.]|uniref:glutamine amidotransferase-related protein n=1 Tax=Demequina sp. TaxID=2050685 RepID=UPI003A8B1988